MKLRNDIQTFTDDDFPRFIFTRDIKNDKTDLWVKCNPYYHSQDKTMRFKLRKKDFSACDVDIRRVLLSMKRQKPLMECRLTRYDTRHKHLLLELLEAKRKLREKSPVWDDYLSDEAIYELIKHGTKSMNYERAILQKMLSLKISKKERMMEYNDTIMNKFNEWEE